MQAVCGKTARTVLCGGRAMKRTSLPLRNCDFVAAKSLIDLVASRLALRAPGLRAGTALTRPTRSAQRLPSGRHAVPTAGRPRANTARALLGLVMAHRLGSSWGMGWRLAHRVRHLRRQGCLGVFAHMGNA